MRMYLIGLLVLNGAGRTSARQGTYGVYPALFDPNIHLSAVQPDFEPRTTTRVDPSTRFSTDVPALVQY